jgi:hypothetical protein
MIPNSPLLIGQHGSVPSLLGDAIVHAHSPSQCCYSPAGVTITSFSYDFDALLAGLL